VWQEAVNTAPNGKPTAAHVEKIVRGRQELPKAMVYERQELNNGIVQCSRCEELYDGSTIEYCPYCAYTQEQRIQYLEHKRKKKSQTHVANNAGDNEWYTPQKYIDAARVTMGDIDLDPASTEIANTVVGASQYFTEEDDGLTQEWHGRVWMNPPYARPLIEHFVDKLVQHVRAGDILEAIVLVNNATETAWFVKLISVANVVCFPQGRIKFWQPDGTLGTPLQGQAITYIGKNHQAFIQEFGEFGWLAMISKKS